MILVGKAVLFEDAPEIHGHRFVMQRFIFLCCWPIKDISRAKAFDRACDLPGLKTIILCPRDTTAGAPTQVPGAQEERGNVNRKISRHPLNERMSVQVVSKFDAVGIGMPAVC
jgi:hypothetical protein